MIPIAEVSELTIHITSAEVSNMAECSSKTTLISDRGIHDQIEYQHNTGKIQ